MKPIVMTAEDWDKWLGNLPVDEIIDPDELRAIEFLADEAVREVTSRKHS